MLDELNITPEKQGKMHTDILVELLAWQSVIVDKLAAMEAQTRGVALENVMNEWIDLKRVAKASYYNEIYGNHGPDLSDQLFEK